MSIGGLPALNDGNNARAALYNRLINDYGVQMFISAGNSGPGVNTIGDPSVATDVVSVAASRQQGDLAGQLRLGRDARSTTLFNFSSRGPREDGGFKPNITAPGSAISTTPLWQPGGPVAEAGLRAAAGLRDVQRHLDGLAAGRRGGRAAAVGRARRPTRTVTPAALRRAIYSSAKWISGASRPYGQGNGLFDVTGAWNLLKGSVADPRRTPSTRPVCTPISDFLATPTGARASTTGAPRPTAATARARPRRTR